MGYLFYYIIYDVYSVFGVIYDPISEACVDVKYCPKNYLLLKFLIV